MKETLLFYSKLKPPSVKEECVNKLTTVGPMSDKDWFNSSEMASDGRMLHADKSVQIMESQVTDEDVIRFIQGVDYEDFESLEEWREHASEEWQKPPPLPGPLECGVPLPSQQAAKEFLATKLVIAIIRGLGLTKVEIRSRC